MSSTPGVHGCRETSGRIPCTHWPCSHSLPLALSHSITLPKSLRQTQASQFHLQWPSSSVTFPAKRRTGRDLWKILWRWLSQEQLVCPVLPLASPGGGSSVGAMEGRHSALIKPGVPTSILAPQKAVCRMTLWAPYMPEALEAMRCSVHQYWAQHSGILGETASQGKEEGLSRWFVKVPRFVVLCCGSPGKLLQEGTSEFRVVAEPESTPVQPQDK